LRASLHRIFYSVNIVPAGLVNHAQDARATLKLNQFCARILLVGINKTS
jgi:hypothetical protein